MVFSSATFIFLFLPIVLLVYFILNNRDLKNIWLFLVSLFFYSWGEPVYIVLMLFSIGANYLLALKIDGFKTDGRQSHAKGTLILALGLNVVLLGFFKYFGFMIDNLNLLFGSHLPSHELPLPIGISFYTFQIISYVIDVYWGKVKVQKNLIVLGTYVAMFPQLIAGPIVRYITIEDELKSRTESIELIGQGLQRFVIGLGKKVIIANQMGLIADTIYSTNTLNQATIPLWLGAIAYTFQIYFDFSGYSDMAIGLGKIFGFHFLENFNYPYISKSITDFWRRWHISLSSWFKDYIYIPLGGNRKHFYRNLIVVWGLTGLWHGANWNFIFWGIYYGSFLIAEKRLSQTKAFEVPIIFKRLYTLLIIVIGWVIFRLESVDQLVYALKHMFIYRGIAFNDFMVLYQNILFAMPFFILAIIGSTPMVKIIGHRIESGGHWILKCASDLYLIGIFVMSIAILLGEQFNPFIYFRF